MAGTDGVRQEQLLTGIPATANRVIVPIRFSPDGQKLHYALQPLGIGGSWVSFGGRYDSLYVIPTAGGQPTEIFQCPPDGLLCLGDFAGEGDALRVAHTDMAKKTIYILAADGVTINEFSFPDADFLGYPSFGPSGELAFYVAAIGEHVDGFPVPQPGTVYRVQPPYDGEPQPVKSGDSVATLMGWLDTEHLVYNSIDPGGNWGTAVTTLSGDALTWGSGPTQFITILR